MKKTREAIASWNRHDLGPFMAILEPDFVTYDPLFPEPVRGRETLRKAIEGLFEAFPDLHMEILSLAVNGDVMASENRLTGTFKMPMKLPRGIVPPTGKSIEVRYATFSRLDSKGLGVEQRYYYYDLPGFAKQLGIKI